MNSPESLEERSEFLARCVRCSQCKFVPTPKSKAHASICPSIDYGNFHAYSASGQLINGRGLLEGKVEYTNELLHSIQSCTMCGGCDSTCKVNYAELVQPLDSLYALRARIVNDGHSPAAYRALIENLHDHGNKLGRPRAQRARWAEGLGLMVASAGTPAADVLLHIGGDLAYAQDRWPALRSIAQVLLRAGESLAYAGTDEGPSGSLAFDLGYTEEARAFATATVERVRLSGALTFVTFSATALAAFRAIYPRFGLSFGSIRVLHVTEYVRELVAEGRLQLHALDAVAGSTAYHDPCKLGRLAEPLQRHDTTLDCRMNGIYVTRAPQALRFGNDGCYEAPRALMEGMGVAVVELERNRSASYCCGAGGGTKEAVPEAARLAAKNRLAEAQSCGASTLVTACNGCSSHLAETARADGIQIQVLDMLDLLVKALQPAAASVD